jgi:hypothetical protein
MVLLLAKCSSCNVAFPEVMELRIDGLKMTLY